LPTASCSTPSTRTFSCRAWGHSPLWWLMCEWPAAALVGGCIELGGAQLHGGCCSCSSNGCLCRV
jgi:hypothetical protein